MPRVRFEGQDIICPRGANLHRVLQHAGAASSLSCLGLGACGACAVEVSGASSPQNARERWRLAMPPHIGGDQLRLACQVTVQGDLTVTRHGGFWGQLIGEARSS